MARTPGLLDIYSASRKAQKPSTIGAEDQIPTGIYLVLLHLLTAKKPPEKAQHVWLQLAGDN